MTFHPALQDFSFQQSSQGKLPQGLINEIKVARQLGKYLVKELGAEKPSQIEAEVKKNKDYWAKDVVVTFSRQGLYSRWLPKFVGGGGGHPLAFYGLNLELGGYCLGISNLIGAHYVALGLVSATSSFSLLEKITKDIVRAEKNNDHCTVSLAITEPGAGSDMEEAELLAIAKVCTKAVRVDGGYKITGQKIFISNSLFAKWIVGSAFLDLAHPEKSTVIFAVRAEAPGVSLGRTESKMGQNASPANVLFFENVFVADEEICFSPEQFSSSADFEKNAEFLLNDLLSLSRAGVGTLATGAQQRILEISVNHLNSQSQAYEWKQIQVSKILTNFVQSQTISWEGHLQCFARGPYKDLQSSFGYTFFKYVPAIVQQYLLGPLIKSVSGRDSLRKKRRESITQQNEKMIFGWGAMTKSVCTDYAMESVQMALDLIGADGSTHYWELEKLMRDIKLLQIYEGTNELNRLVAFKNLIGLKDANANFFGVSQ